MVKKTASAKSKKGSSPKGCNLKKCRILVNRNIRNIMQEIGITRAARGVGVSVYDNSAVPLSQRIVILAAKRAQLCGLKTVREVDIYEASLVLNGESTFSWRDCTQWVEAKRARIMKNMD